MLKHRDTLIQVIDDIMTNMFFLFPDLDDDGVQITDAHPKADALHVGIHFNTEHYLHFAIDRELVREMAGNFMGLMPDELDDAALEHMALETANIIGGNFLVKIDPEHKLKLSIPEILDATRLKDAKDWSVAFSSEGRVLRITPLERN
jgi:CheY-specific phosphatase CheX